MGSATTLLQKISLDLARKAQAEGREIEEDPELHRRATEIRAIPSLESLNPESVDPESVDPESEAQDPTESPSDSDDFEAVPSPEQAGPVADADGVETSTHERLFQRVARWFSRRS